MLNSMNLQECLNIIEKFYLSVTKNKSLLVNTLENEILCDLPLDVQEQILDVTLRHPISLKYPPSISFQKFFFRSLIEKIENLNAECSDALVEAYTSLLSVTEEKEENYKSYRINEEQIISLQEHTCFVTHSTTGLQTWEGSKYLAEWVMQNTSCFDEKVVLELGCGIGLLGITTLKCCNPENYIFTDKSWEVLKTLSTNIKINFPEDDCKCSVQQLVWSAVNEECDRILPDIILGADIVFDTDSIPDLTQVLNVLLQKKSSCAYISSTIRNPETNELFLKNLEASRLSFDKLEDVKKSVFIYDESSKFVIYKVYHSFS